MPKQPAKPLVYLGVDGGQSHTLAVIGDSQGKLIGRGEGGPCNHAGGEAGKQKLRQAVSDATNQALREAALTPGQVRFGAACFGMSGGPADKTEILAALIPAERLEVTTDAHIALLGGAAGEPGVVVVAGTGSMAFGRNAAGKTARAGGWGYVFGDEGGGFDLVRQALRAALRYEEGWGPATSLRRLLLRSCDAENANELMHSFYREDVSRPQIASLANLVDRAAAEGDEVAQDLLCQAGRRLAELAGAVRNQLFPPAEPVPIVHAGGVFQSPPVLDEFRRMLKRQPGNAVMAARFEPVVGALLRAYELAAVKPAIRSADERTA